MSINWDDLRYFVALAETGSLTAAANRLGASQPTMGRRLKALEAQLDTRLLERAHDRHELTASGSLVYELAKEMQQHVYAIERNTLGRDDSLEGKIRISTTSCIASSWLVKQLPDFLDTHPGVEIEIVVGLSLLSLLSRQADIALRVGQPGPEALIGQRVGMVNFGLYASANYLERQGTPEHLEDLPRHEVIDSLGSLSEVVQVGALREAARGARTAVGCDSLLAQLEAARRGMGIVALPHDEDVVTKVRETSRRPA